LTTDERQLGAAQRRGDGDLEPAGRLEHDQGGRRLTQMGDQPLQAGMVTGDGEGLAGWQQVDVEPVFGDIDADEHWRPDGVLIHDPSL
jgi:hypothetical protein